MPRTNSIKQRLGRLYQNCLVGVPGLTQLDMARDRVRQFLRVWHYLSRTTLKGDYLEFGVFEGMSFELSIRAAAKHLPKSHPNAPRFFAFDSFQGLPELDPKRDPPVFKPGEYSATKTNFRKNIRRSQKLAKEIQIIPGFYADSLTSNLREDKRLSKAVFVNLDCDIYPSTKQALDFVTPLLQTGCVLYFDDWFYADGDMQQGEAGACHDWLKEQPSIQLVNFGQVGTMGQLFIVNMVGESTKL